MLRSSEEFRFVMEFICETMRPTGSRFRVITDLNMRQLTRDQAVEASDPTCFLALPLCPAPLKGNLFCVR